MKPSTACIEKAHSQYVYSGLILIYSAPEVPQPNQGWLREERTMFDTLVGAGEGRR
jgi:hypothetical protein